MATDKKPTAGKADAAEPKKTAYIVISPLSHDLIDYAVGDEVDLTEAEAVPLLGHTVRLLTAETE